MAFSDEISAFFPNYLSSSEKDKLASGLVQFYKNDGSKEIDYRHFYRNFNHNYFLQSDLVREIRLSFWDRSEEVYEKRYTNAIIVTNTCDISSENPRESNIKECLFAPIVDLSDFLNNLRNSGLTEEKLATFLRTLKSQLFSNIFYLPPPLSDGIEYIALLDQLFWFPTLELNSYIPELNETKISSLDYFGHYLFILKLSYHLCRLPETVDREIQISSRR